MDPQPRGGLLSEGPAGKLAPGTCHGGCLGLETRRLARCELNLELVEEHCSSCSQGHARQAGVQRCPEMPRDAFWLFY